MDLGNFITFKDRLKSDVLNKEIVIPQFITLRSVGEKAILESDGCPTWKYFSLVYLYFSITRTRHEYVNFSMNDVCDFIGLSKSNRNKEHILIVINWMIENDMIFLPDVKKVPIEKITFAERVDICCNEDSFNRNWYDEDKFYMFDHYYSIVKFEELITIYSLSSRVHSGNCRHFEDLLNAYCLISSQMKYIEKAKTKDMKRSPKAAIVPISLVAKQFGYVDSRAAGILQTLADAKLFYRDQHAFTYRDGNTRKSSYIYVKDNSDLKPIMDYFTRHMKEKYNSVYFAYSAKFKPLSRTFPYDEDKDETYDIRKIREDFMDALYLDDAIMFVPNQVCRFLEISEENLRSKKYYYRKKGNLLYGYDFFDLTEPELKDSNGKPYNSTGKDIEMHRSITAWTLRGFCKLCIITQNIKIEDKRCLRNSYLAKIFEHVNEHTGMTVDDYFDLLRECQHELTKPRL